MQLSAAASNDSQSPRLAVAPTLSRVRLVNDFNAPFIRFKGREPQTLEELEIARAEFEHRQRLAEIKTMAKNLERLQEHLPALAERGIKLADRKFNSTDFGKTLRILSSFALTLDDKLYAALLEIGFTEVERKPFLRESDTVKLRHGRWLTVVIEVSKAVAQ
jgi:hypothetical protein